MTEKSRYVVQDPSALQDHVNQITGAPPIISGKAPARRGTTNGNARGGSQGRKRRREWLVQTFRADADVIVLPFDPPVITATLPGMGVPACRCYRCGKLLTAETLTVDRIIPGCRGGTYARSNIRPACGTCNSSTGATTRRRAGK